MSLLADCQQEKCYKYPTQCVSTYFIRMDIIPFLIKPKCFEFPQNKRRIRVYHIIDIIIELQLLFTCGLKHWSINVFPQKNSEMGWIFLCVDIKEKVLPRVNS